MNFKKSALMLSFAAAMSLLNTTVFAVDMSKSEIIKATGKVAVKKTTSPEFKKLNSNLKLSGSLKNLDGGDKVRTFNDSTADLALKDTCILMVKEQSVFEVPKILTQKDLKTLKAQQGSVLFKVAKGNNFQVQTADVICGVKGTMFSVTVIDNFQTALETTGLQLGYLSTGGTEIEVYEGEVEVINRKTNQKINLLAKEKAAIIPTEKDMTKAIFNPQAALKDKWGDNVHMLMETKSIKDLTDTYDKLEKYTGKLIGNGSSYKSKLYYDNEVVRKLNKVNNTGVLGKNQYGISESDLNNVKTLFGSGKKFHANEKFARITKYETDKTFTNSSFGEVYLGNNTVAACKAANGETSLITEPIDNFNLHNGIMLMGMGLVKIDTFNDSLGVTNELLANVYSNGNEFITAIRNNNNNLYWRGTEGSDPQKVPTGDVAYVYNMNTNSGKWVNAAPGSIPTELSAYNFSVVNSLQQEKHQVEKQNKEKKKEAAKNIGKKLGNVLNKKGKKWF